jgi:hypothetical protein
MEEQYSIQGRGAGDLALFRARKGGIVDVNHVKKPGRPGGGLDRFENHRFTVSPNRNGISFKVKSLGQPYCLHSIGVKDLGSLHDVSLNQKKATCEF